MQSLNDVPILVFNFVGDSIAVKRTLWPTLVPHFTSWYIPTAHVVLKAAISVYITYIVIFEVNVKEPGNTSARTCCMLPSAFQDTVRL